MRKKSKIEVTEEENKENIPSVEKNYMVHVDEMDISDESDHEIDLFVKNRKRKRSKKRRSKPRKRMNAKNVKNRESNKMKLRNN